MVHGINRHNDTTAMTEGYERNWRLNSIGALHDIMINL